MRSRALGELGGTLDLDEALALTVEAAAAVRGVDAAVVRTTSLDGSPLVGARPGCRGTRQSGRSSPARRTGAARVRSRSPTSTATARSRRAPCARVSSCRSRRTASPWGSSPRTPTTPLLASQRTPSPGSRRSRPRPGPTIDTARRFREARAAGDHDAVTGLPGRSSFHDALAREVARAHRYERRLALLVLDVDDFHGLNDRLGQLGGDEVLAATAALVRGALREADVAYRAGGDEFAVLLPESARIDAEGLFARVLATVRRHQTGLSLSGGIAELQPDDDALTLYERAEEALHRAKAVGKGTAA